MAIPDDSTSGGPGWGVHFHAQQLLSNRGRIPAGCPTWAKPLQADTWCRRGVVMWQDESRRVAALTAEQALTHLEALRTNTEWQVEGLSLTEQVTQYHYPDKSRARRKKEGDAQSASSADEVEREVMTVEVMRLSPEQARELLVILEQNEVALGHIAEADKKQRSEALLNVYRILLEFHGQREGNNFDWAGRPVEWVRDGTNHRWVCERTNNRAVVNLEEAGWHWTACVAEPSADSSGFEAFVHLAQAVSWAEEQLLVVEQQRAEQIKIMAGASKPANGGSAIDLAPYRIDAAALEPARLTYRIIIELDVTPDHYQVMELNCGRQLRYDERYAAPWQLAIDLQIDDAQYELDRPLGPNDGWNRAQSSVTYYQQTIAIEQAQAAWNQSRIVERYRQGKVLRACYGVQEVETGFVLWLGGCENRENPWPAPAKRAEYMAERAEELTLAHALDVEGFRAYLGSRVKLSDDEILEMLHGRRARSPAIPEPARAESRRWLAAATR